MKACRACGHSNPDAEKFCQGCGRFLEFTGEVVPTGPPVVSPEGPSAPTPSTPTWAPTPTPGHGAVDAPTTRQPVVAPSAPVVVTPTPSRQGSSFPQLPDASLAAGTGLRPSDVGERPSYRAPQTEETDVIRPGDIVCPSCHVGNDPARTFCRRCGNQLRNAAAAMPMYVPPPKQRYRPPVGAIIGAAAVVVAAVVGLLVWKPWDSGTKISTTTTVTGKGSTTAASVATTVTVPPGKPAPCPDAAALTKVRDAVGPGKFGVPVAPPAGARTVLQYQTPEHTLTICRDQSGAYWYFNRGLKDEKIGIFLAAQLQPDGVQFRASSGSTIYVVDGNGTTILPDQIKFEIVKGICANPGDASDAWKARLGNVASCTEANVIPWKPA